MSHDALLGRVLMLAPPDDWPDRALDWLDEFQPAGVILFGRHLPGDLDAARAAIARLQAWAFERAETLLIAMDEEGGFVSQLQRLMPVPPSARALAWAGEPRAARAAFARYGARMHALGVNIDFAPVCDVNNNPQNPVIGARSFGSDPEVVIEYARAVHEGLAQSGVLSCVKHFPGHGDTDLDSHLTLPVVPHERARFDAIELRPFVGLLQHVPLVMVAHLACPALTGDELPATVSRRVCTEILRHDLGFQGVAVSDAMDMQGVASQFDFGEAAVRAMQAGCDLLLYCSELDQVRAARAALQSALDAGRLSHARLDEAIERVDHLRVLAAARGDAATAAETLPSLDDDIELYARLCRAGLRLVDAAGWRRLVREAQAAGTLRLVGWNQEVMTRFAHHCEDTRLRVETLTPEMAMRAEPAASIVILAERRPVDHDAVTLLRQLVEREPETGLANLLTPEIDSAFSHLYHMRLRSADCSTTMLDVVTQTLFA